MKTAHHLFATLMRPVSVKFDRLVGNMVLMACPIPRTDSIGIFGKRGGASDEGAMIIDGVAMVGWSQHRLIVPVDAPGIAI